MRTIFVILTAVIGLLASVPASAAPFATPLSDAELSSVQGGAVQRYQRLLSDGDAVANFRQTADINRMTFDNWFANEGTVLIVNNLLR